MTPEPFTTIILAAGASSRMGVHKARVRWRGQSFLGHCVQQSFDSGSARVMVVWGALDLREALDEGAKPQWIQNKNWKRGPLSSLQCALRELKRQTSTSFALVRSVDRPRIAASTLSALIQAAQQNPEAVVQAQFGNKRAHPLVYPSCMWPEILALDSSGSIRPFLDQLPAGRRILVAVKDPTTIENFDRPEDLLDDMQRP